MHILFFFLKGTIILPFLKQKIYILTGTYCKNALPLYYAKFLLVEKITSAKIFFLNYLRIQNVSVNKFLDVVYFCNVSKICD